MLSASILRAISPEQIVPATDKFSLFYIFHGRIVIIFLTMGTEYAFSKKENKFAKLALVALAAGVLTLGSVDPASAAKSGGRVGGQAFKSSSSARSSSSSPRINNSRYKNTLLQSQSSYLFFVFFVLIKVNFIWSDHNVILQIDTKRDEDCNHIDGAR